MCFLRLIKDKKKLEKITDESETGFNFSTSRHKHAFCTLIMLENMLNK